MKNVGAKILSLLLVLTSLFVGAIGCSTDKPDDSSGATQPKNGYVMTYKLSNPNNHEGADEAAWNGSYVGGDKANRVENGGNGYNILSKGGACGGGILDGETSLEIDNGKYVLTKTLSNATMGVNIVYCFEGTVKSENGNNVTLNVPQSGYAEEKLSSGFLKNGVTPNYSEKKTSKEDERILRWFNTAYITLSDKTEEQAVVIDSAKKTLAYSSEQKPDEKPDEKPENKTVLEKKQTVQGSSGPVEVTTSFYADGTYKGTTGAKGRWFVSNGKVVAENGSFNEETKVLTVTWYSGKAKIEIQLTSEDITALSVVNTPYVLVEKMQTVQGSSGPVEVTTSFYADGTYKGTTGAKGTWYVEDGKVVAENGTFNEETKVLTVTWYSGKAKIEIQLTDDDIRALSAVKKS